MIRRHIQTTLYALALAGLATPAQAVITNLLPVQKGAVVATCFSSTSSFDFTQDPNGFVVLMVDASSTELGLAPLNIAGLTHNWQKFHNDFSVQNGTPNLNREWTAGNLGEVFGTTFDDASPPNVYVAASTVYGVYSYPAGNGPGTVYRLDGSTGSITAFNSIPNGGASLGNLTYWKSSGGTGHLYVTSFDDGLIYQLDMSGALVGTFDHGVDARPNEALSVQPDNPAGNYTQRGRRLWGIEAHQGRLFYGVWTTTGTEVWSVALDAAGTPQPATAQRDIPASSFTTNYPVSDIAFSDNGELYTGHRYHRGLGFGSQHQASVYEFVFAAGSWDNPSPANKWRVGNFGSNRNNAGGVDVDCVGGVWASGDAISFPSPKIYGSVRIPPGGNTADSPATLNCHVLDYDNLSINLKNYIGDIEIYDPCAPCFEITEIEIECPQNSGDPYHLTFKITNRSTQTAHYIWHNPCPAGDLPAGSITGQPTVPPAPETGPQLLPAPIAPGECTTVSVDLPAPNTGGNFCWNITLLNESGGECCTDKVCLDLPDCDCFILVDKSIDCTVDAAGIIKYTMQIKIQNTSGYDWYHVNLLPGAAFSDATFDLSASPVPHGSIYIINTCVSGNAGDTLCFNIAVHNEDLDLCCSKECCIILPPCNGAKPDECDLTKTAPCCPDAVGLLSANATITICNGSPVARTYNWNLNALPASLPDCPGIIPLGAAAFSPPTGSITVGPNSCVNIPITINCEAMEVGRPACYEVCIQQEDDPTNRFCCQGRVVVPSPQDPVFKDMGNPGGVAILVPGAAVSRAIEVSNPTDRAVQVVFDVASLGDFVEISSPNATSAGFDGVKRLVVDLDPFETEIVSMDLRAAAGLPFDNILVPVHIVPLGPAGDTMPTAASLLAIAPIQQGGAPVLKGITNNPDGSFTMTFTVIPGRTYQIQTSQDLGSIEPWVADVCTPGTPGCPTVTGQPGPDFTSPNGILEVQILPDPVRPLLFYRAIEVAR